MHWDFVFVTMSSQFWLFANIINWNSFFLILKVKPSLILATQKTCLSNSTNWDWVFNSWLNVSAYFKVRFLLAVHKICKYCTYQFFLWTVTGANLPEGGAMVPDICFSNNSQIKVSTQLPTNFRACRSFQEVKINKQKSTVLQYSD